MEQRLNLVGLIKSDLKRVGGGKKLLLSGTSNLLLFYRIGFFLGKKKGLWKILYVLNSIFLRHYRYKTGILIHDCTQIGPGFKICHYPSIIINYAAKIGRNATIYHEVTIGETYGPNEGVPIIGDNVVLCAGCKVIGDIKIGNNVIIGANSVVTKSIPDNSVVAGVPARIICNNGLEYVNYYINMIKR